MTYPADPSSIAASLQQASQLIATGRLQEASLLAEQLLRQAPADSRTWHLASTLHLRAGRIDEAAACLERAVAAAPGDLAYQVRYGQCLARLGRRREALAVAERLAEAPPESAPLLDALGTLFSHCDEPARALVYFRGAVAVEPGRAAYLYNLATAQRMVGDLDGAEASLEQLIARKPDDYGAYYTRADLRTQTPERNHVEELERVIERGLPDRPAEVTMCFAIAKELEDVGEYARAFEFLKRGCERQRRAMSYDVATDVATIDRIIELHDRAAVADDGRGLDNDECIFVVGLPRSGTTLVERILAAHSDVQAAGELPAFPQQAVRAVTTAAGGPVSKLEFVARSLEVDPAELGRRYLEETRPQTGRTPRFVDKMPLNYLYAGLIHRALPRARIVALERDPMDSCNAMYKTLFTGAYPFSYDLGDLGRYYLAWQRLMRHWRVVLGDALLVIRYEELVVDQEAVSRRLLAHCGLAWQDACLAFHTQQAPVTTASAVQVRRPVYATSVGRWRQYSAQLAELAQLLDAGGAYGTKGALSAGATSL
jgi:tetratricopeptide (TPR) repeat protein